MPSLFSGQQPSVFNWKGYETHTKQKRQNRMAPRTMVTSKASHKNRLKHRSETSVNLLRASPYNPLGEYQGSLRHNSLTLEGYSLLSVTFYSLNHMRWLFYLGFRGRVMDETEAGGELPTPNPRRESERHDIMEPEPTQATRESKP